MDTPLDKTWLQTGYNFSNAGNEKGLHFCKPLILLVPLDGLELSTYRLQVQ